MGEGSEAVEEDGGFFFQGPTPLLQHWSVRPSSPIHCVELLAQFRQKTSRRVPPCWLFPEAGEDEI